MQGQYKEVEGGGDETVLHADCGGGYMDLYIQGWTTVGSQLHYRHSFELIMLLQ